MGFLMSLRVSQKEWRDGIVVEWWRVLARHRQSRAGDPRDKVFAFWGMRCRKGFEELGVSPDYGSSVEALYVKIAVQALRNGDVEILSVPRIVTSTEPRNAGDEEEKCDQDIKPLAIPSWAPDWRTTTRTPGSLMLFETTNIT